LVRISTCGMQQQCAVDSRVFGVHTDSTRWLVFNPQSGQCDPGVCVRFLAPLEITGVIPDSFICKSPL
jgi:hypothetical protein